MDYRNIKVSGAEGPMGGVFGTSGQVPDHAVFYILVADVEATCVRITGLLTHPLLSEGSATLAVACGYAGAPGDRLDVSQPCAGGLTRVSVLDCRDETADHLGRLGTAVQVQGCREVSAAVP
jgi:hypothetical protein